MAPISSSVTKRNPSEQEAKSAGVGPISSMAFKVSRAAKFFNPVPMLGQYSSALSWASDIVGNAASVFGWAAPVNLSATTRVIRNNMPYATNYNKVDSSMPLSIDASNQVEVMPGFGGTNTDELDIVAFASKPFYYTRFEFTTSNSVGDTLLAHNVGPADWVKYYTHKLVPNYCMGPLQYLSYKFAYWRGSITYKLKFVKTEFHSGRIAIAFTPVTQYSGAIGIASSDDENYIHRDIVDLRETNEFTYTVPYMYPSPYLMCNGDNYYSGKIRITVLDKLVAPDTVSPSITVLVETCGGPDIEFAGMKNFSFIVADNVVYQSAPINMEGCAMTSKMIGAAETPQYQLHTSKAAIGERITNLRALLKRFYGVPQTNLPVNAPAKYNEIIPCSFVYTNSLGATYSSDYTNDLMGELLSMFCYSRGGTRLKIKSSTAVNRLAAFLGFNWGSGSLTHVLTTDAYTAPGYDSNISGFANRLSYNFCNTDQNYMEVQVPQYTMTHSRANASLGVSISNAYRFQVDGLSPKYTVVVTADSEEATGRASILTQVLRAGSDDFNLSEFVSIPVLVAYAQTA